MCTALSIKIYKLMDNTFQSNFNKLSKFLYIIFYLDFLNKINLYIRTLSIFCDRILTLIYIIKNILKSASDVTEYYGMR